MHLPFITLFTIFYDIYISIFELPVIFKSILMYWHNKSSVFYFSAFFFLIYILSCKGKPEPANPKQATPVIVDVIVVSLQNISNVVEANGSVVAGEFVELHPEVSGG